MSNALNIAVNGLSAADKQLAVISANVANASTPGYTAKRLTQTSVTADGQAAGVQTGALTRSVNLGLLSNLWQQNSVATASQTSQTYLNQLQQTFGTPDSATSFATKLTTLKDDFISLNSDPSNNILQTQIVNDAQNLATSFNSLSQNIQSLRNNTVSDLSNTIGATNQLLSQIASLNNQIAKQQGTNNNIVDLQDQRDSAIASLSLNMNIQTFNNGDGTVNVSTSNGTLLADTQAQTLIYSAAPLSAQSYYPTSINGIMLNGVDVTSQITSGAMGGLISLRDAALPQAQAMMDETARQMAARFNAQNVKLFTDASGNVPANTPTGYAGFSGTIQVNSAVVGNPALLQTGTAGGGPFNASDNINIQNVLNYAFGANANAGGTPNTPFNTTGLGPGGTLTINNMPASGTITNFANNVISSLAQQYSQVKSDNTYQTNYQNTLQKNSDDQGAVSIDKEMTDLVSIQNAYASNARMITTISQMFKELLSSVSG